MMVIIIIFILAAARTAVAANYGEGLSFRGTFPALNFQTYCSQVFWLHTLFCASSHLLLDLRDVGFSLLELLNKRGRGLLV